MPNPEVEPQFEVPKEEEKEELSWYLEERASEDLENLRVLRWFGPEQKEILFAGKNYEEMKEILIQLDYDRLLPTAEFLKKSFGQQHQNEKLTKEETNEVIDYARTELDHLIKEKEFKKKETAGIAVEGKSGEGFKNPEDLVRIYFAPKLQKESIRFFLNQITENIKNLDCDFKLYPADWYEPSKDSPDKFRTSRDLNRFILYFDRENPQDITSLLNKLTEDKELFKHLEDSGEWANSYRFPLATGISLAEGSSRSWDLEEGQVVRKLKKIFRGVDDDEIKFWRASYQYDQPKIKEAIQTRSLAPLGRSTKMPPLKINI